jgi:hypothetical protein
MAAVLFALNGHSPPPPPPLSFPSVNDWQMMTIEIQPSIAIGMHLSTCISLWLVNLYLYLTTFYLLPSGSVSLLHQNLGIEIRGGRGVASLQYI